ncbi:hypothetical protein N781_06300 [Pontibacillus halophilus JSM 076056 = DSM 19796]|uniref:HTH marR-type domain-containing protein n=1 Tax=Pontibacillus halophilus JSM 076056 = DSM 19796 TaxID=1385510 RepID=A0A0A5GI01_9BACI|nr:MarR family transcriptional regulator [Pontibacillus halophilus]KGX90750.1 hypothetical protein N781_06300 [Pontibacillus halophilus JSM 076056 = DSM 19796]
MSDGRDGEMSLYRLFEAFWMELVDEEDRFKSYGLSSKLEAVLTSIIRHPAMTLSELANYSSVTKSAISQHVKRLEELGFLSRMPDPNDRRVQRIVLSEEGERYKEDLNRYEQYVHRLFEDNLNQEELKGMQQYFEKLLHSIHVKRRTT